jgi:hypothetical protein
MAKRDISERFWTKVDTSGDCWTWTGSKDKNGYGRISIYMGNNVTIPYLAHRKAWELTNGNIAQGMHLCHKCDNPSCVNPAHMFVGTHDDNMRDMRDKGRMNPGHVFGEKHGCAKLTEDQIRSIRKSPEKPIKIAERFGISRRHASDIKSGKSWKHVA